jgi:predicted RecB family nuclease
MTSGWQSRCPFHKSCASLDPLKIKGFRTLSTSRSGSEFTKWTSRDLSHERESSEQFVWLNRRYDETETQLSRSAMMPSILHDEERIWNELLTHVQRYPEAPIYHYGSYEPRAIAQLAKRYGTPIDGFTKRLVNVQ